jgi:Zn-finger nucleic acid-binding protein
LWYTRQEEEWFVLCPICKVELKMTERQGVEIDYCPQCRGVWLDRGELDKIIERSASGARENLGPEPVYAASRDDHDGRRDDHHDERDGHRDERDGHQKEGQYRDGQLRPKKRKSLLGDLFDF